MRHRQPTGDGFTHVELTWIEKRIEHWIRFGRVAREQIVDRRRRIVSFRPGAVFAFVRWAANDYGTVISRIDIVRAVGAASRSRRCRSCGRAATSCSRSRAGPRSARCSPRSTHRGGRRRSLRRRARSLAPRPQPHRRRTSAAPVHDGAASRLA
jgi:hypothetical protein